jgi:hypothetical protein
MSAPLIKLGEKAYLFGGYTKEQPVYLSDYWVKRVIVVIANSFIPLNSVSFDAATGA